MGDRDDRGGFEAKCGWEERKDQSRAVGIETSEDRAEGWSLKAVREESSSK